ncbi:cytochrome c oxidase subunit 3 [Halocalculus aciditolerans]|uniref:Cytochrome c oxidase subunit III n=1 Tax=Halocalculus aciditolerans TaxID=1383812 RepID=A0A830FMM1_9EURY|nr:heme-copper oxidase subunit III [Halocalculus aciditolerans]GGL61432.1 cytochrome c oxidase subunit III [Halocalculus aciditolerans]
MTATDESDGHGYLPATADFPKGYGEASWWPFIATIGAVLLYSGAILFVFAHRGTGLATETTGLAVFGLGATIMVGGFFGWIYHAFAGDWISKTSHNDGRSLRLGMILFLATDVATFGAGFAYYFFIRAGTWPPAHLPAEELLTAVLAINTILLVTSSFTYHWSEVQLKKGNHGRFMQGLAITFLLGAVFVGGQVYEYMALLSHGFELSTGIFGSAFFGLTGLHGLHVSLGVILIGVLLYRAARGHFTSDRHVAVTTVSWYWHFVDAVWIFLVAVLYIGSVVGTEASPF